MGCDETTTGTSCIQVEARREDRIRLSVSRLCDVDPETTKYYMRVNPESVIWVNSDAPTPVYIETNVPRWNIE